MEKVVNVIGSHMVKIVKVPHHPLLYKPTICGLSTQILHVHVCSLGCQFLHGLLLVPADSSHKWSPPFIVLSVYVNIFQGEKEVQDIVVAICSRDVELCVKKSRKRGLINYVMNILCYFMHSG